jgi:hypothetical protein
MVSLADFKVIVNVANRTKSKSDCDHRPHKRVIKINPQKSGGQKTNQDQTTTHGGSSGFLLMGLRAVIADTLPNLTFDQSANKKGPQQPAHTKAAKERQKRAERNVPKNVETRKGIGKAVKQLPKHKVTQFKSLSDIKACFHMQPKVHKYLKSLVIIVRGPLQNRGPRTHVAKLALARARRFEYIV